MQHHHRTPINAFRETFTGLKYVVVNALFIHRENTYNEQRTVMSLTFVPYDLMTSAVGLCPQSWDTMMGNCDSEGRCLHETATALVTHTGDRRQAVR